MSMFAAAIISIASAYVLNILTVLFLLPNTDAVSLYDPEMAYCWFKIETQLATRQMSTFAERAVKNLRFLDFAGAIGLQQAQNADFGSSVV